jgi:hypothetical protein
MRCKDCGHFASIYHKNTYSFEEFDKDVHRLATVFHTEWFYLLGGEPTLVGKTLPKYIDSVRHSGICDKVGINTNGILLPKLEFVIPMFDKIILSLYKSKHYETLKAWLDDKKYPNIQIDDRPTFFLMYDGNKLTEEESDESYKHCTAKVDCNFLYKGCYYKCAQSIKVWDLLKSDIDRSQIGVDIYQPNLEMRLNEFLTDNKKTLACSWCHGTSATAKHVPWKEI